MESYPSMEDAARSQQSPMKTPHSGSKSEMMHLQLDTLIDSIRDQLPQPFHPVLCYLQKTLVTRLYHLEHYLLEQRGTVRPLQALFQLTGIPPVYFVLGGTAATLLTLRWLYKITAALICDLVGIVYPISKTWNLLEERCGNGTTQGEDGIVSKEDDRRLDVEQWCAYWMLFSALKLTDYVRPLVPLHNTLKLTLLLWLMHPKTRGASLVFKLVRKRSMLPKNLNPMQDEVTAVPVLNEEQGTPLAMQCAESMESMESCWEQNQLLVEPPMRTESAVKVASTMQDWHELELTQSLSPKVVRVLHGMTSTSVLLPNKYSPTKQNKSGRMSPERLHSFSQTGFDSTRTTLANIAPEEID